MGCVVPQEDHRDGGDVYRAFTSVLGTGLSSLSVSDNPTRQALLLSLFCLTDEETEA